MAHIILFYVIMQHSTGKWQHDFDPDVTVFIISVFIQDLSKIILKFHTAIIFE